MTPADGDPVSDDHNVLRLPKPSLHFTPDGYAPAIEDVTPSTADKARTPIRVSVWDATLTTVEQARGFRSMPTLVLAGRVSELREAGASRVVYEPLAPPEDSNPGANGHAGIEGMERSKGEPKQVYKDRCARVALCLRLIGW